MRKQLKGGGTTQLRIKKWYKNMTKMVNKKSRKRSEEKIRSNIYVRY